MPQNITKLAIQAYMFMSRRQKETLTKDHFIQKLGHEIKRYITFKLKDFRGSFFVMKKRGMYQFSCGQVEEKSGSYVFRV